MKRNKITLVTSGVLLVIFLCMLFTFQVRQTEVAVVTTFGRYSRSVTNAGFQWRLPWPVQKVYRFDNRLQTFESKIDQPITRDQISLLISIYLGWRITDPKLFLESFNGDITKAEQTLEPIARNAKNGVIGLHRFGDLISTNEADLKFDQIEKEMFDAVQAQAKSNYGLAIEALGIKQLNLPDSITSTVFERMKKERETLVATYQSEGDREGKNIKARADAAANDIIARANAEKEKIIGRAEQEAAKYYAQFEQNPELAKFLFDLRAVQESLKERTSLILGPQTPPFNLLNGATTNNNGSSSTR
jgi:membrane protease subunit HflC